MATELESTAYHEAAHVIALRHFGQRALSVCVKSEKTGETVPDDLPSKDTDVVLVAMPFGNS